MTQDIQQAIFECENAVHDALKRLCGDPARLRNQLGELERRFGGKPCTAKLGRRVCRVFKTLAEHDFFFARKNQVKKTFRVNSSNCALRMLGGSPSVLEIGTLALSGGVGARTPTTTGQE